ncbi:unnamed protein product [Blepharisma stoltei]|uniref:Maturase K n=1 Tax=Blepharisma stoltei TaxID=1481888 RepID=A0AAU9JGY3_9CILI|nr:unnamed protein product [Blepharisma stoltei]
MLNFKPSIKEILLKSLNSHYFLNICNSSLEYSRTQIYFYLIIANLWDFVRLSIMILSSFINFIKSANQNWRIKSLMRNPYYRIL